MSRRTKSEENIDTKPNHRLRRHRSLSLPQIVNSPDLIPKQTGELAIFKVIDANFYVAAIDDSYYYVQLKNNNVHSISTKNLSYKNIALFSKLMTEKMLKKGKQFNYTIRDVYVDTDEVILMIDLFMTDERQCKHLINYWLNRYKYTCADGVDMDTFDFSFVQHVFPPC